MIDPAGRMAANNLAVRVVGDGLPILIVHGWMMSGLVEAQDFEPVFTSRPSTTVNYRRVYVDLPGMGASPTGTIRDLDSVLESVSSFVEQHIIPSRFLLIGSSCGAYLVRALAYKYATHLDGICLRVPVVEPESSRRDVDPFKPAVANELLLASLSDDDRKKLDDILVQTPVYIAALKRKLDAAVLPAIAASDAAALDPIRNDPNRYRLTATMHTPEAPFLAPSLVLTGRQDPVVGYRDAWQLTACYPHATFVVLDRADHGLPVDEPDLFGALVHNWLWRVEEWRRAALGRAMP